MHHTVVLLTQLPLPRISPKLRYVPHLSRAAGLRPSVPLPSSITAYKHSVVASEQTHQALVNVIARFC